MFKSIDGGTSWSQANNGLTSMRVRSLKFDPTTPTTIYAATLGGGVFTSTDSGDTWSMSIIGLNPDVWDVVIDPTTPTTIYAGTWGSGVFRSMDGGVHWNPFNIGMTHFVIDSLVIDPSTPATLFAGTDGGGVTSIQQSANTFIYLPMIFK